MSIVCERPIEERPTEVSFRDLDLLPTVPESEPDPVTAVLRRARDLIRIWGWEKYDYHSVRGYCLAGAMRAAAKGEPRWVRWAARRAVKRELGVWTIYGVWAWNDHPFRRHSQVIGLLDQTVRGRR